MLCLSSFSFFCALYIYLESFVCIRSLCALFGPFQAHLCLVQVFLACFVLCLDPFVLCLHPSSPFYALFASFQALSRSFALLRSFNPLVVLFQPHLCSVFILLSLFRALYILYKNLCALFISFPLLSCFVCILLASFVLCQVLLASFYTSFLCSVRSCLHLFINLFKTLQPLLCSV